jgi:Zn-dependent peptidase ImmA (M78 family)/transcriptional regulator with XRE-family HTH domain
MQRSGLPDESLDRGRAFEPSRLILARRRRGLKRTELARRAGLKARTITAYEVGERVPPEKSLEELAKVLAYPIEFFYRGQIDTLQGAGVSFRALTKMTAPQRDRALAAGELALELAAFASERFELPEPQVPDLRLESNPESAAMALRAAWGLSDRPVLSLVRLLESKGVRVFSLAEKDRALDGFSFWRGGEPFIFLNTQKSSERSRYDAAHELGHLVLHRHGGVIGVDVEREAMAFASAFLMPRSSVLLHAPKPPSIPSLIEAKKWWGVSLAALIRRLYELGIITRWYYRALFIQLQKLGYRDHEPQPMARELSAVWPMVFEGMREAGLKRKDIANVLSWPLDELKGLVFQLVLSGDDGGGRSTTLPSGSPRDSIRLVR